APELGPPVEELADERSVEDLLQGAAQRRLDAGHVAHVAAELLEGVERGVVDVRDQRVAEPAKGFAEIVEVAVGDRRGAAEQRAGRAPAVARPLPAGGERLGQDAAQGVALRALIAEPRGVLERGDRLLLDASSTEGELEEAPRAIV